MQARSAQRLEWYGVGASWRAFEMKGRGACSRMAGKQGRTAGEGGSIG